MNKNIIIIGIFSIFLLSFFGGCVETDSDGDGYDDDIDLYPNDVNN